MKSGGLSVDHGDTAVERRFDLAKGADTREETNLLAHESVHFWHLGADPS